MRDDEYRAMFDLEERLWWYEGMRAITASIIDRDIGEIERARILDVGCGTGFTLQWLKKRLRADEAFGVDVSPRAAELWKLRDLNTAVIASGDRLPFGAREFDLVTCFDVVNQFDAEGARRAVSEFRRVLKPGGWLLIREPAYEWMRAAHDRAVSTRHRYNRKELLELLRAEGLAPARSTYANWLLFWAAAPHRLLSKLKRSEASDVKPVPRVINGALLAALKLEARLIERFNFPFGLSVFALARKQR